VKELLKFRVWRIFRPGTVLSKAMMSPKAVKFLKFTCVLAVIPGLILAHEYGPDPGYTAAPGDNPTSCVKSQCHVGTVNSPANGGNVAIQMPNGATTYTPGGAKQLITVLITDANRQSWGFQMTARLASNPTSGQAGNFTDLNGGTTGLSTPVQVLCATSQNAPCPTNNPVQWVEHSLVGWSASVAHKGSYSYQMYWTPPATDVGKVTLYVAGNASNSANTAAPDATTGHIYTSNITLTPASATTGTPPSITAGGVVSAGNFGAFTSAAPGSWIEIYGNNLAPDSRSWAAADFNGSAAPTNLDNVTVTVGGVPAYVSYISPGQIDAQIPAGVGTGAQPIVVTTPAGSSTAYSMTINATQAGLLAPPSFNVSSKQYAAFFHSDLTTFVMPPEAISGVTSAYAKPGETIIIYGVGFGPVSPASVQYAGQVVSATSSLNNFSMSFGGSPGVPLYYGLAPGFVGLYQFNLTVPQIANNDFVPLTFNLGGTAGSQTLYTAVHN
jgi:uncharacterized protein (TIGR03437 family)